MGNLTMTPEYVAFRTVQGALANRELVFLPQYLIPVMPFMAIYQMFGYLNIPSMDRKNPMEKWSGNKHANEVFKAMGAKI